ncbi:MAG: tRNA (adenosine(37)-N6)-threonylcarbamoyltransferase complex transferase subunit TsaD [Rickettsiales bacterium]|nr:MAG: tRNA (adenosine(37)-N6)-threonylcarbamoyltransferase complex transferase subunit TsaD [Rickettsiales bacterium]
MIILGIESSCDETAIAIVNDDKEILANNVISQIDIHKVWGGVIPEVASRHHLDVIDKIVEKTLQDANLTFNEIDAISATTGPGLMGGLIVGALTGQTLASVLKKPFIPVNHLEAHLLTTRLTNAIEFPYLTFLISGGHTQILLARGIGDYEKIGETIDDSLGECFDKVGQMLDLEYPAGPKIENLAKNGDENKYKFVKPLINAVGKGARNEHQYNFSFSGLKTAVRMQVEKIVSLTEQDKNDISASFQKTILDILKDRFKNVIENYGLNGVNKLVFAGGVSANQYIKNGMSDFCKKYNFEVLSPPLKLCTDNGVMIAWAGLERYKLGLYSEKIGTLEIKANWEL